MLAFTAATTLAALAYLGVEVTDEDQDPNEVLDDTLGNYNLTTEQFLNEETCFAIGYHRGLGGRVFGDDDIPANAEGPDETIGRAMEEAFALGMEARSSSLTPPPSLVYAAWKAEELSMGSFVQWARALDLSSNHRLAHSVTIGSGKEAVVVPAGTPVDVIDESVNKDDQPHVIVCYDGLPLLIPNPEGDPRIVSGDTVITTKRARKPGKPGGKKSGAARQRGPALKDAITEVMEGKDGGNGPLQDNGQFAGAVLAAATRLDIRDKASAFVRKADRHVPYYCNCYKPLEEKDADKNPTGRLIPNRTGVDKPLAWVVAGIKARKFYLKGDDLTHEERYAQIPEEYRDLIEAGKESLEVIELSIPEKADKAAKPAETPEKPAKADKASKASKAAAEA